MPAKPVVRLLMLAALLAQQALLLPAQASGALRCGTTLVEQGASKSEVIAACGQPTRIDATGATWYYEHAGEMLAKRLRFSGDVLQFVDDVPKDSRE